MWRGGHPHQSSTLKSSFPVAELPPYRRSWPESGTTPNAFPPRPCSGFSATLPHHKLSCPWGGGCGRWAASCQHVERSDRWPSSPVLICAGKGLSSATARHWLQGRWTWPRQEVLPSHPSVADAAIGRSPPLYVAMDDAPLHSSFLISQSLFSLFSSFNSRIHGLG
jgi:hypothetical protein